MPIDERLIQINIEDEMKSSYLDYAMSVIVGRALPDVRDGFKPVHRRIFHGMNEMGLAHNRAYRKSAKIVGEIMGNYHPHGDSAIYDTLVRMAQDFNMRYPLSTAKETSARSMAIRPPLCGIRKRASRSLPKRCWLISIWTRSTSARITTNLGWSHWCFRRECRIS